LISLWVYSNNIRLSLKMGCAESRHKTREMGLLQPRKNITVSFATYDVFQLIDPSTDPINSSLPSTLLGDIFKYLDGESLNQVALTCKYWCSVSNNDKIWSSRFRKDWAIGWYAAYDQNKGANCWKLAYKDKFELEHNSDYQFKLVLAGTGSVGKTALIKRFVLNSFDDKYTPTLSLDLLTRGIRAGENVVKLQVWDIGSRAYSRSKDRVLKSIQGAVIVVDITSLKSLTTASDFIKDIEDAQPVNDFPIIIVGNKSDLDNEREFGKENIQEHLPNKNIAYFEISAKDGTGIEQALSQLGVLMVQKKKEEEKLTEIAL